MKKIFLLLFISSCWISCDKNRNNQYSTWFINGESFYSRDVSFETNKGGNHLSTDSKDNGFNLGSEMGGRPHPGYIGISTDYNSYNPALFRAYFYRNGTYYSLSRHNPDSVLVSLPNGKVRYEMPVAWFVNYNNPADSVQISGTFNEP